MHKKLFGKIKSLKPIHYIVIFLGIVLYFGAMIGVINYQSSRKIDPPKLEVTTPQDGDTYSTKDVLVQGSTDPRVDIFINNTEADVDRDGNFSQTTGLNEGENTITVIAKRGSLTTEKKLAVSRITPKPVVKKPVVNKKSASTSKAKLNSSGPETLWIFEVGSLSAAGAAWHMSREKLRKSKRK